MRTRSQSRNLHHQQQQAPPPVVEPFNLEEPIEKSSPPLARWDDTGIWSIARSTHRGFEVAIVVPEIHRGNLWVKQVVQLLRTKLPPIQAPILRIQGVSKEDFQAYVKTNDAVDGNMKLKVKHAKSIGPISRHAFQICTLPTPYFGNLSLSNTVT
ncbi:hypothetical protein Tco_1555237 [Tanacetum coccineum]